MGTAPIEYRDNEYLKLAEELRQRRALKWSEPGGGQIVSADLLDRAIVAIVELGYGAGKIDDGGVRRFDEAWHDL